MLKQKNPNWQQTTTTRAACTGTLNTRASRSLICRVSVVRYTSAFLTLRCALRSETWYRITIQVPDAYLSAESVCKRYMKQSKAMIATSKHPIHEGKCERHASAHTHIASSARAGRMHGCRWATCTCDQPSLHTAGLSAPHTYRPIRAYCTRAEC